MTDGDSDSDHPAYPVGTGDSSLQQDGAGDDGIDLLQEGTKVGRFLVLERVGAGAVGVVYAAYDPTLDRKIALKLLRPRHQGDPTIRQSRMEREAQAMAKLSHPNVGNIFDVGVHEGKIFLAIEYLGGGTLRQWAGTKTRTWQEILRMYIAVGRGLVAAHAEGLIHRDFKPDNVLLDKNGVPKVVDFGLVRLSIAADSSDIEQAPNKRVFDSIDTDGAAGLTRTGVLGGTPAYMAPEQFLGSQIDARTDQFSFCVALYEALYGIRPFAGESLIALAESVTQRRIRPPPRDTDVPTWLRNLLVKVLVAAPEQRFQTMEILLRALGRDRVTQFRRRAAIVVGGSLVAVALLMIQHRSERRRREFDRQIAEYVTDGKRSYVAATSAKARVVELRTKAFLEFDRGSREGGEQVWGNAREASAFVDEALDKAELAFRRALDLDRDRLSLRQTLAEVLNERAWLAEVEFRRSDTRKYLARMLELDTGVLRARWFQPGSVTIDTSIPGDDVRIERYTEDSRGSFVVSQVFRGLAPVQNHQLEPGSYRAILTSSKGKIVRFPFQIARGQHLTKQIDLSVINRVSDEWVYIPAGEFIAGEVDESLRTSFLDAAPIHVSQTAAFLIGKHEVTYRRWIDFLESLPYPEADRRAPFVSTHRDYLRLRRLNGAWHLELRPTTELFKAAIDEPIRYPARSIRREQMWTKMPVGGVSVDDIDAFLHWFSRDLPGARLCTEAEWERAARGADDRLFPHGDVLNVDDANFDLTYGRKPLAFGPDEVGSHPASASPFGLEDVVGNVLEITRSHDHGEEFAARGGGYYYDRRSARITNREPVDRTLRYPTFGFRVCADVPGVEQAVGRNGGKP